MRTAQQMLQQASLGETNFNKPEFISQEDSSINSEFAPSNSMKQPNALDHEMRKQAGVREAEKGSVSGRDGSQDLQYVS